MVYVWVCERERGGEGQCACEYLRVKEGNRDKVHCALI